MENEIKKMSNGERILLYVLFALYIALMISINHVNKNIDKATNKILNAIEANKPQQDTIKIIRFDLEQYALPEEVKPKKEF